MVDKDAMTFKILMEDTHKVVHRSVIRPAKDDRFKNKRVRFEPDPNPKPDPNPTDEDTETEKPGLTFACRRLKIDQGLSRQKKRKQIRRQDRRPTSTNPMTGLNQSTPEPTNAAPNVERGEIAHENGIEIESKTTPTRSQVYDIEEIELDDIPKDGGGPNLVGGKDFEKTPEHANDAQDKPPPTTRRSNRNRGAVDRLSFHTKGTHSSLKSLVKGFLLGLTIHYNYDSTKPRDIGFQGRQPELNQNPTQFRLETLTLAESSKLRELQTLDMLQDMIDPDPEDHIWKCIAVTRHKIRDLNKDDTHVKVKAVWTNGEESWIRLDALRIQDPYPLITYAIKKKLTRLPNWK